MSRRKSSTKLPLPMAEPEEVGFSSERLVFLHPRLQKYIDTQSVPNLVMLVARHGKIIYYEALGYIDCDSRKPVQKDTIFRLWSNSKPIAGVATMICVEDGLLSLDDPVSKFLPAFTNPVVRVDETQLPRRSVNTNPNVTPTIPADREITLRDCLRNTTGLATARSAPIQYIFEYKEIIQDTGLLSHPINQPDDMRKMIEALARLPLDSQPGTRFVYQAGYPIIGLVIQIVSGMELEEFYHRRIFGPLKMNDTSFYLPKNKLDRFSVCYERTLESGKSKLKLMEKPETSERFKGPRTYFEAGGGRGGVLSTVGDYARFAQMLLNGGELEGVRILSRKSVEIMTSSHTGDVYVPSPGPPGLGFGLGVGVYEKPHFPLMRSVGTYGWSGAAGTSYFADPKEDLIGIIFTQVMNLTVPDNLYQDEFERLVYQALI